MPDFKVSGFKSEDLAMPVEIKELIIRANIVDSNANNSESQIEGTSEQKQEIITACVAQVLKILERKQER